MISSTMYGQKTMCDRSATQIFCENLKKDTGHITTRVTYQFTKDWLSLGLSYYRYTDIAG